MPGNLSATSPNGLTLMQEKFRRLNYLKRIYMDLKWVLGTIQIGVGNCLKNDYIDSNLKKKKKCISPT